MADDPKHDKDHGEEHNPLEDLLRQLGISGDPAEFQKMMSGLQSQMQQAFTQMQHMMRTEADAPLLDPELVARSAQQAMKDSASGPEPEAKPSPEMSHELRVAVELADSWLNEQATSFASTAPTRSPAWSREQWLTSSMPRWIRLTEPIVNHMADALQELGAAQIDQLPEGLDLKALGLDQIAGYLRPLMRRAAGSMFTAQMGEALGQLAGQVLSGSDLGMPIANDHIPTLVASNVAELVSDLGVDAREVEIYVALREVARQRLFTEVGWLEPQLIALVEHYAREIRIDPAKMEDAFRQIQQLGPEELAITVDGSVFEPDRTAEQEQTLARLETLMALVEGWVDDVVSVAAAPWMPTAPVLGEAIRRRRAAGGPTEKALQALFGLELRPRRVRDAANLWAALRDARGVEGRDAVWGHPDHMPTPEDLDDPLGFVAGEHCDEATAKMDAELRKLLEGERGH